MSSSSVVTIDDVLSAIKQAWMTGRRIVPLVGAGLSVDSGMPVVQGIERYLAMLHVYIQHHVYLGLTPSTKPRGEFQQFCDFYRREPDDFVRDFQWPDRFLLQQDLCYGDLLENIRNKNGHPNGVGQQQDLNSVKRSRYCPEELDSLWTFDKLVNASFRQILGPAVGWKKELLHEGVMKDGGKLHSLFGNWRSLIERFTEFDEDLADALIQQLHQFRRPGTSHQYLALLARLNLWQTILTFNFDPLMEQALTDQGMPRRVFAMERGETFPHELLVQRGLSIIKMHGDTHRLLMDARLDRPLSKDYLERLERCLMGTRSPLERSPLILVLGCGGTEERCLSIVRHFHARKQKLSQSESPPKLLSSSSGENSPHDGDGSPLVIWVHFERKVPLALWNCLLTEERQQSQMAKTDSPPQEIERESQRELQSALRKADIWTLQARNPGFFLMHLHSYLTTRHPASRVQYLAHIDRPIMLTRQDDVPERTSVSNKTHLEASKQTENDDKEIEWDENEDGKNPVTVFDGDTTAQVNFTEDTASQRLAEFTNDLGSQFYSLWIDLEDCYSVIDVVGRIVDQARRYDTTLAPGVFELDQLDEPIKKFDNERDVWTTILRLNHRDSLQKRSPDEQDSQVIQKAIQRVRRILRRGTYCLAFDSVEAFGWPPTTHHGEIQCESSADFIAVHQRELVHFLLELCRPEGRSENDKWSAEELVKDHRGSLIGIAINARKQRYNPPATTSSPAEPWYQRLKEVLVKWKEIVGYDVRPVNSETTVTVAPLNLTEVNEETPLPMLETSSGTAPTIPDGEDGKDAHIAAKLLLEDRDCAPFILFRLAACRRTRQLVALRKLLKQMAALPDNDRVDQLLNHLAERRILLRVEGGGYWMNRPLRDSLYSFATSHMDPIRLANHLAGPKDALPADQIRIIARELWLVFAEHDRWADWYYDQNHLHSSDPHAFFEYVYHRTSSLRAITVLIAWAVKWNGETIAALMELQKRVSSMVRKPPHDRGGTDFDSAAGQTFEWFLPKVMGLDPKVGSLAEQLNAIRLMRLNWLTAVWKNRGEDLAITTGAERTILWIRWLIAEDLPRLRSPFGSIEPADPSLKKKYRLGRENFENFNEQAESQFRKLAVNWLELWSRLAFNRMDYKTSRLLWEAMREPTSKLAINSKKSSEPDGDRLNRIQMEIAKTQACESLFSYTFAHDMEQKVVPQQSNTFQSACARLAEMELKVRSSINSPEDHLTPVHRNQILVLEIRTWLLQLLLDAHECRKEGLKYWIGFPLSNVTSDDDIWTGARTYCQEAIDELHSWLSDELAQEPHTRIHHVWLEICRARIELLLNNAMEKRINGGVEYRPDFEKAYSCLDAARSFAKGEPEHRRAIVELYAVQVTMAHAEYFLTKTDPGRDQTSAGRNKLHAALEALGRAQELLRRGRRNTRWWRFFYNLRARIQVWLIWERAHRAQMPSEEQPSRSEEEIQRRFQQKLVRILERVRSGLSAIRHRANLEPRPVLTISDLRRYTRYPFHIWQALYYVGSAATMEETRQHFQRSGGPPKFCEDEEAACLQRYQVLFREQFRNFTESFGLDCESEATLDDLLPRDESPLNHLRLSQVLHKRSVERDVRSYVCVLPVNRFNLYSRNSSGIR